METHKQLTIGLFGFGVVGEGLYKVLQQTPSLKATIRKVCIKHSGKKREAPAELFTTDRDVLLNDPEINVIVEVINESGPAFEIVSRALKSGKSVVSASKKMLAEHLPELLQLQKETNASLLYEAAACASIPVIRNLEEYYDNDLLHSIKAIVNGSTNFILTKMFEEKLEAAIHIRFGLPARTPAAVKTLIKKADRACAFFEATQLAGFATDEALLFFGRPPPGYTLRIEPLPPAIAQERYVHRHHTLSEAAVFAKVAAA